MRESDKDVYTQGGREEEEKKKRGFQIYSGQVLARPPLPPPSGVCVCLGVCSWAGVRVRGGVCACVGGLQGVT